MQNQINEEEEYDQEEYLELIQAVNDKYQCKEDLHFKLKHEDVSAVDHQCLSYLGLPPAVAKADHLVVSSAATNRVERSNLLVRGEEP